VPGISYGFSRNERLLKRPEFLKFSGQGRKIHTDSFIILWNETPGSGPRIGITVSRKVGNAVMRNYLKRLIREFFRCNKNLFLPADFNIIAKQSASRLNFTSLSLELGKALRRLPLQQC
jgi:ribonuclease P protein component